MKITIDLNDDVVWRLKRSLRYQDEKYGTKWTLKRLIEDHLINSIEREEEETDNYRKPIKHEEGGGKLYLSDWFKKSLDNKIEK